MSEGASDSAHVGALPSGAAPGSTHVPILCNKFAKGSPTVKVVAGPLALIGVSTCTCPGGRGKRTATQDMTVAGRRLPDMAVPHTRYSKGIWSSQL